MKTSVTIESANTGLRLTPDEVESIMLLAYVEGINMDASQPAVPLYWTRRPAKKEN